jgi:hypothetical protein
MTLTYYERGKLQERLETANALLEKKFGPLSPAIKAQVEAMSPEKLRQLNLAVGDAHSLKDLGLGD